MLWTPRKVYFILDHLKIDETQPIQLGQMSTMNLSFAFQKGNDKTTAMWRNPYSKIFGLVMEEFK
jgi:hypothetical protein